MTEDYLSRCDKSFRGVLESSYLTPPGITPKVRQQIFSALSVKSEQAALCGGQICAWCLEAIPDGTFERHHITKSEERCKCVNYKGQGRMELGMADFQCHFFLIEDDERIFSNFSAFMNNRRSKSSMDKARYLYLFIVSELYPKYHKCVPREKFLRVTNYCASMTRDGIRCGLSECTLRMDVQKIKMDCEVGMFPVNNFAHFACQGCVYEMQRMTSSDQYVKECSDLSQFIADIMKDDDEDKKG
jgi:hypothetical protein